MSNSDIKILVIEDEPDIRENLETLLDAEGYRVESAALGEEGVRKAIASPPDLIFCDVMMPGLDGWGVLEELRKYQETGHIPFIFLTAKASKAERRKGMGLGASDYIEKPFTRDEILRAIATQLENKELRQGEFVQLKKVIGDGAFHVLNNDSNRTVGLIDLALEQAAELKEEESDLSWEELFHTLEQLRTALIGRMYVSQNFLKYIEERLST